MFDALVNGRIDTGSLRFEVEYHDIEELNRGAGLGRADISKISCAVLPAIAEHYALLDSGAALGRGNGPLLRRRYAADTPRDRPGAAHNGQCPDGQTLPPNRGVYTAALLPNRGGRRAGRFRCRGAHP